MGFTKFGAHRTYTLVNMVGFGSQVFVVQPDEQHHGPQQSHIKTADFIKTHQVCSMDHAAEGVPYAGTGREASRGSAHQVWHHC